MAHGHKRSSWVAVLVLIVATVLLGFALPLQSWPLGIAGVVVGVVGLLLAWKGNIMEDAT